MSQEENVEREIPIDIEDLFVGSGETYAQAYQRAQEESKSFTRTEFFRMDKLGVYRLRILPLAPCSDGAAPGRSYEYPVRQLLLEISKPSAGSKSQSMYVTVPRATDAGLPVDLIDTYRHTAVEQARAAGDEPLAEKIGGGSFGGGLKYGYGHAMYVLDITERAKGIQLLTLSHSQYKDLDERKLNLWKKKLSKNPNHPCPVSSVSDAYPVEIEKKKKGSKTEYAIDIDNESDADPLSREELQLLLSAPRIPQVVYRYSRYQAEATIEYLRQCDVRYEMHLMEGTLMKEAVQALLGALPKEDTSSFSFDKRTKDNKENPAAGAATLDELFDRYDAITAQGHGDKTEQGQELRGLIRAYIEQENLSVRVTRSTTNKELLDMIELAMTGPSPAEEPASEAAGDDEPIQRRR